MEKEFFKAGMCACWVAGLMCLPCTAALAQERCQHGAVEFLIGGAAGAGASCAAKAVEGVASAERPAQAPKARLHETARVQVSASAGQERRLILEQELQKELQQLQVLERSMDLPEVSSAQEKQYLVTRQRHESNVASLRSEIRRLP